MHKLLFLLTTWYGSQMGAFTPSADFIIGEMAKRCVDPKAQLVGMLQEGEQTFFVNYVFRGDALFIVKKTNVAVSTTKLASSTEQNVNLFVVNHLLKCQGNGAKKISDYLNAHGINLKKVSHGFLNYEPVFIIGADPNDTTSSQLLIEKQSFLPVREKTREREVVFDHWSYMNGALDKKWPSTVTVTTPNNVVKIIFSSGIETRTTRK